MPPAFCFQCPAACHYVISHLLKRAHPWMSCVVSPRIAKILLLYKILFTIIHYLYITFIFIFHHEFIALFSFIVILSSLLSLHLILINNSKVLVSKNRKTKIQQIINFVRQCLFIFTYLLFVLVYFLRSSFIVSRSIYKLFPSF